MYNKATFSLGPNLLNPLRKSRMTILPPCQPGLIRHQGVRGFASLKPLMIVLVVTIFADLNVSRHG